MSTHILSCKEKFKSAPSARKLMLTLFRDINGQILEQYQEKGETVNSVRYSAILQGKLKPAICSRHGGLLSKGLFLLHGNAWQLIAAATVTTIQKLKFETITYAPYSSDLTPPHYHVLACLRKHCEDEVFTTTTRWRRRCISGFDNSKTFYFLLGYRSLLKDIKSALQRTVTTWKNNMLYESVCMMCISIQRNLVLLIEVPM
jgi:hypothetical protein